MTVYIVPIVEGQTEAGCIERLLQRVWTELLKAPDRLQVLPPSRGKRDALIGLARPEVARKVEEAYAKLAPRLRSDSGAAGLLLLLLDAESDCPAELAPKLLAVARKVRSDADIACILAKRMLENWIVAGASTLSGVQGLPASLPSRNQFEDRSGVFWLDAQYRSTGKPRKYKKTVDAEPFIRAMNLHECRGNAPSFDKLCRELEARLPRTSETTVPTKSDPPK